MEKRRATRYPLASPAQYRWVSAEGESFEDRGTTRDVSTGGAYILARTHPQVGSRIEVQISLPNLDDTATGTRLFGLGQVVRAECKNEDDGGFAVSARFQSVTCDDVLRRHQ